MVRCVLGLSLFFKSPCFRISLARVNVNNQNYIVPYLIIDGEAFYKQYPYTRKVRKTTNLRHGRSKLNLLVNHLQQFFTEAVTSIAFIKEIENSLQTIKELWTIADF